MEIKTAYELQGALRSKQWTVRAWAIKHGYNPRTVLDCINRFAPETGRKPKRDLAIKIMRDLSETLDINLLGESDD